MSYQVLARKWRPRVFSEMVGQEHVVRALSNALNNDRLHHAYLFAGTRGVGKTTLARIFAKALNCEQGVSATPCGECSACREIDEGRFVDLLEVDAASRTKVDQTRELLDNVPYSPVRGRYKIYLIDEVHMFSDSSFNALLKTLEEPPPHVKFLLATTDPQKVPMTVLSRCLQFNLKRLPFDQIRNHLQDILQRESIEHDTPALALLARGADGSMRDALSLMDQAIAFGGGRVMEDEVRTMLGSIGQDRIHELLDALVDLDPPRVLQQVTELGDLGADFAAALQELLALLHRVAMAQLVPDTLSDSAWDAEQISRLAGKLSPEDAQLFYQIGLIGQRDLPLAPDPRSGFEMVLLRMLAFRPQSTVAAGGQPKAAGSAKKGSTAAGKTPVASPAEKNGVKISAAPRTGGGRMKSGSPVDLSRWNQVTGSLKLGGVARQLADNCVFHSWDGSSLVLKIAPHHQHLQVASAEQRLHKALTDFTGGPVKLHIRADTPDAETPAQLQEKAREQARREALSNMAGDPLVKAVEERFGATLVAESVRPIDV